MGIWPTALAVAARAEWRIDLDPPRHLSGDKTIPARELP